MYSTQCEACAFYTSFSTSEKNDKNNETYQVCVLSLNYWQKFDSLGRKKALMDLLFLSKDTLRGQKNKFIQTEEAVTKNSRNKAVKAIISTSNSQKKK